MAWSYDRTGDAILWAGVSGLVALMLNTLCTSSCYWVFLVCWFLSAGTAIALSYITVSGSCLGDVTRRLELLLILFSAFSLSQSDQVFLALFIYLLTLCFITVRVIFRRLCIKTPRTQFDLGFFHHFPPSSSFSLNTFFN